MSVKGAILDALENSISEWKYELEDVEKGIKLKPKHKEELEEERDSIKKFIKRYEEAEAWVNEYVHYNEDESDIVEEEEEDEYGNII